MKNNNIITITGPTGSGKTTLLKYLCANDKFKQLISVTTRPPRPGEVDGVDYHFIGQDEFEKLFVEGKICQHVKFQDNYYGTTVDEVKSVIDSGSIPVCIVEPTGVEQFQKVGKKYKFGVTSIFIHSYQQILVERYLQRMSGSVLKPEEVKYHADRIVGIFDESTTWIARHSWDLYVQNKKDLDSFIEECRSLERKLLKDV